ncbi:hypothetical protein KDW_45160 [Dictyobacter vulcani]|uniref:Uncharacterized protein n=1 Tax=Dictyobacter vulcani TaxID=2607529 RepID=A0A5J4KLP3_9CHLR|nr:hypothetical protein [Dictyobacter vulcani]GER90354.1 hypothetical protein KDW_45160 [Dictyobacter vulcani]
MSDQYSQEQLAALRANETRCVRVLAACRRFAVNVSGAAGNYATFAQNEEVLLESFHEVELAHASPDGRYEQLFAERCQRAGLTTADVSMLQTRWQRLQQLLDGDEEDSE